MYFPITLINIIIKYSIFKLYRNKIKKSNILRMLNIIMPFLLEYAYLFNTFIC